MVERQRHRAHAEAAEIGLALEPMLKRPAWNGDRDGKAGEDEARGIVERKADAFAAAERALDQQRQRRQRALADQPDDEAGDQEGDDQVQERDEAVVDPVWKCDTEAVLIKASRGNAGHHQAEGLFTGIGRLPRRRHGRQT